MPSDMTETSAEAMARPPAAWGSNPARLLVGDTVFNQVGYGISYGLNVGGIIVGNFYLVAFGGKFFLESHDKLNQVQGVGVEVIHKGGCFRYISFLYSQLVYYY